VAITPEERRQHRTESMREFRKKNPDRLTAAREYLITAKRKRLHLVESTP